MNSKKLKLSTDKTKVQKLSFEQTLIETLNVCYVLGLDYISLICSLDTVAYDHLSLK